MLKHLCESCQKNNICSDGTQKTEQICDVACMWPQKCRCGTTENVKVVLQYGDIVAYTIFAICRECFFTRYHDERHKWDKLSLPPFTEDGKGFKTANDIIREYIEEGNLDIRRRIFKKRIRQISKEIDISEYTIELYIKSMRRKQGIKVI